MKLTEKTIAGHDAEVLESSTGSTGGLSAPEGAPIRRADYFARAMRTFRQLYEIVTEHRVTTQIVTI